MRRYIVFGTVCLGLILSSSTAYAASVALAVVVTDLNTTLILAGWILSVYSLMYTIGMPLAGKISEKLGSRVTFIAYVLIFTVGSVLCALSPNIYFLIAARALQAIGGSGFMPCAAEIVSDEFPEARQRYIGLFSSIFPIGMIIGPNLGGWMVEVFGWRSIFWFNVPLGVIVLVFSQLLLPTAERKSTGTSIDFIGAGLLFCSLFAFMLGLTEVGNSTSEVSWVLVGILFALAMGLLVPFLRWERRAKEPIIDLDLLRSRPFLAANAYNLIYGICALGILSLIPLYAVSVYKMSVLESGVLLTPRSIGMIAASGITSFFIMKWGYRRPILVGTLILALGFSLLSLQSQGIMVMGVHLSLTVVLFALVGLCGISNGIVSPAANNACIELMPDKVATIVGLRGMFRQLGSAIGISVAIIFIHNIVDVQRAFFVVLFASALITLISIPTIFGMPAFASLGTPRGHTHSVGTDV